MPRSHGAVIALVALLLAGSVPALRPISCGDISGFSSDVVDSTGPSVRSFCSIPHETVIGAETGWSFTPNASGWAGEYQRVVRCGFASGMSRLVPIGGTASPNMPRSCFGSAAAPWSPIYRRFQSLENISAFNSTNTTTPAPARCVAYVGLRAEDCSLERWIVYVHITLTIAVVAGELIVGRRMATANAAVEARLRSD